MSRGYRDLLAGALALLALLLLEASGADMVVAHLMAGPEGFIGRESLLLARLHDGGRLLAWAMLGLLLLDALRTPAQPAQLAQPGQTAQTAAAAPGVHPAPSRRTRLLWLGVVLATALLVPGIKRFSRTSCPWDLVPFGGSVPYVPHWLLGLADGGPGHCFPSGHAAGVLAFIGVYFLWRDHRPRLARALAAGVWALGAAFGAVQMLRGAHFLTHVLWAAWACWALAAAVAALLAWRQARRSGHQAGWVNRPEARVPVRARTDHPA